SPRRAGRPAQAHPHQARGARRGRRLRQVMTGPGAAARVRAALRIALSHYVASGLTVALGLLVISGGVHLWLGPLAASAAATGVIVTAPPDLPGPRRGKFLQMLPAPLIGLPLFFAVQMLHGAPIRL